MADPLKIAASTPLVIVSIISGAGFAELLGLVNKKSRSRSFTDNRRGWNLSLAIILALGCAVLEASKDLAAKLALRRFDEWDLAWALCFFALPLLIVASTFEPEVGLKPGFWPVLAGAVILNLAASYCYMRALRLAEISLALPIITFTPVFMLATSPLMLGESPSPRAIWGILCIVAGSYLLRTDARREGVWGPFRALARDEGPRLMFIVALIWSVAANLDKAGVLASSPTFWLLAYALTMTLALTPRLLLRMVRDRTAMPISLPLLLVGICGGAAWILQMYALLSLDAPSVVAIKRTSVIFGVILGGVLLREHGLRERLLAGVLMAVGVGVLAWV